MKLLICNDGSAQADNAMRLGAAIAAACKADVTLFGIVESPGQSQTILDSLKQGQALLEQNKINAELITKSGDPIQEIKRRTEEAHYDLVIIGAVQKKARGFFWMSSKSYKIIKEVAPPVLTFAGSGTSIKRILVCSGGKIHTDAALKLISEIARGAGANVTIFHVLPEAPGIYSHWSLMEEEDARLLDSKSELGINLRGEKEKFEALGVATEIRFGHGPVLDEILEELRKGKYDLVVSGSALSRSFRTYMMGDITREIVNRSDRAVLVIRGPQRSSESQGVIRGFFGRFARF
ncbi:MAG TPA: universal stress protein [Verrucomicrobiae bacterium]|nr:universal stress protein [Verrucomicrobiae bacterium]